MKNPYIFIILMITIAFGVSCTSAPENEPIDFVDNDPIEPMEPIEPELPPAPVHKSVTPDLEPDEGIYAPDLRGKSQETVRNIKAEKFAKEVSDSVVKEDLTGAEKTYMRVEFKYFDDRDILERVRELFERASRDDNYVIDHVDPINRKTVVYKIWSQKGRINLERTIKNALEYEDVEFNMKEEHYLEITPNY